MHLRLPFASFVLLFIFVTPELARADSQVPICVQTQECVDSSLSANVSDCGSADPTCPLAVREPAVSAQDVANRAITHYRCDTITFSQTTHCRRCFTRAKELIRSLGKRDGDILLEFFSQVTALIERERDKSCSSIRGTTGVIIAGNVDSRSSITVIPGGAPTFTDLFESATFSSVVQAVDPSGQARTLYVFYFHTGSHDWTISIFVDGSDVVGFTAGDPVIIGSIDLSFMASGARATPVSPPELLITPHWINGQNSEIGFSFIPFTELPAASSTVASLR